MAGLAYQKFFRDFLLKTGVIRGPSSASVDIKLGDAAGARKFRIYDSSTALQASIDSDGNAIFVGTLQSSGAATVSSVTVSSSAVANTLNVSSSAVANTLTVSSSAVVNSLTATNNASIGGTLTASSGLTASRGVTGPRAVASTAANLPSYGLFNISSTSAAAMVIDAPVAGREVVFYKTGNSTQISSITVNATGTVTYDGTNVMLTFDGQSQFARMIGDSTTRWLLLTSSSEGGYTKSG